MDIGCLVSSMFIQQIFDLKPGVQSLPTWQNKKLSCC